MFFSDPGRAGPGTEDEPSTRLSRLGQASRGNSGDPVARLVERFTAAWERGDRPPAEVFLRRHPLFSTQPEAAIRLIYEEVCLRQGEGEQVALAELVGRFPQWAAELAVLLDCDRLIGAMPAPTFPETGEDIGDFLLIAELGRGARGRCFLAVQPSLSNRQVVLKLTPDDQAEHLSMARLQHTHIMPLYSEHEFPERRLRALCMPYLGGTTLARILAEPTDQSPGRRTGQSLLEVLDRHGPPHASPWPRAGDGPARRFLAAGSYLRAVCWIGSCLADALQYAHDRGLVHMDIKPSNILLTADGQPMLLDFHLAREAIPAGERPDDGVGGTPGYMSPEQESLIAAMDSGRPARTGIDGRSDIFSLGCVLAEMLGVERDATGARSRPRSSGLSTGLLDIVGKCLAIDPHLRYPEAASLAEDLRRHMADLPLRGAPNRSPLERWGKWRRRQPYALFRVKVLLLATLLAGMLAALLWFLFIAPRFRAAGHALVEGQVLLDRGEVAGAVRALTRGAALIEGLPDSDRLSREIAAALRGADQLEEWDRLHRLVDRLRFAESATGRTGPLTTDVKRHCRALWESRGSLLERPPIPVDPRLEERLRDDLVDLAVIASSLAVRLATDADAVVRAHRGALRTLDEAEALFGPSHLLYMARRSHAAALGLSDLADAAARGADRVPPRAAWEHDAVGRVLLTSGELDRASAAFDRAVSLRPQDFWPNFHQGVCAYRLRRHRDAVVAFRVCIALAPDRAECYYNRALAHAALGDRAEADGDLRRAIALDPTLAAAPVEREGSPGRTSGSR